MQLRNGFLTKHLATLVESGTEHVVNCPLCRAKGYICEVCGREDDILFAFEQKKVALVSTTRTFRVVGKASALGACGRSRHPHLLGCHHHAQCPKCRNVYHRRCVTQVCDLYARVSMWEGSGGLTGFRCIPTGPGGLGAGCACR